MSEYVHPGPADPVHPAELAGRVDRELVARARRQQQRFIGLLVILSGLYGPLVYLRTYQMISDVAGLSGPLAIIGAALVTALTLLIVIFLVKWASQVSELWKDLREGHRIDNQGNAVIRRFQADADRKARGGAAEVRTSEMTSVRANTVRSGAAEYFMGYVRKLIEICQLKAPAIAALDYLPPFAMDQATLADALRKEARGKLERAETYARVAPDFTVARHDRYPSKWEDRNRPTVPPINFDFTDVSRPEENSN